MFDFYNNFKLSKKVLVVILTVPMVLALVLTVYAARQVIKAKNVSSETLVNATSVDMLDKIDRNFYERFGDVQAFAYNTLALDALKKDSCSQELQNFINTMTSYYVLYDLMLLCNLDGKVIAVNSKDKKGGNIHSEFLLNKVFTSEEWFKTCVSQQGPEGGAWYSDFCINADAARIDNDNDIGWGMGFAAPVKNEAGQTIGVWYNFANWQEVTRGIRADAEKSLKNNEAFILITDTKGTIIDAGDSSLVTDHKTISENDTYFETKKTHLITLGDYIIGTSQAQGAYTYKGKNWKAITLMPKSHITLFTFFSKELVGLLVFDMICLLVAVYVGFKFSRSLSSKIHHMKGIVDDLSKGKLSRYELDGKDEINEMGLSLNILSESLKQKMIFAEDIGRRSFDTDFKASSTYDVLGNALLHMRNNLKEYVEADKKQVWTTEGLAQFGDILRNQIELKELTYRIISVLVKYLNANQGALFILQEEDGKEPYLELTACYAYEKRKYLQKTVGLTEGLLGQCVLEGDYILLTDVPQNYIKITSGLGLATPRCIFIMPLKTNDKVLGVLELASFQVLEPYQIDFLLKLSENIATTLAATKVSETTQKLLAESQMMTEQMRTQEEEIRQSMEELNATQEEVLRRQADMEKQTQLLDTIIKKIPFPVFVKDAHSRYILANDAQAELTGMPLDHLLNKRDDDFITNAGELKQIRESDAKIIQENTAVLLPAQSFTLPNAQTKILQTHKIPFMNPLTGEKNILGVSIEMK